MSVNLSDGHVQRAFAQVRDGLSADYFFVLASGVQAQQHRSQPQSPLSPPRNSRPGGESCVWLVGKGNLGAREGKLGRIRRLLVREEATYLVLNADGRILLAQSLGSGLSGVKRAKAMVQGRSMANELPSRPSPIVLTDPAELTRDFIMSKLRLEEDEGLALEEGDDSGEEADDDDDAGEEQALQGMGAAAAKTSSKGSTEVGQAEPVADHGRAKGRTESPQAASGVEAQSSDNHGLNAHQDTLGQAQEHRAADGSDEEEEIEEDDTAEGSLKDGQEGGGEEIRRVTRSATAEQTKRPDLAASGGVIEDDQSADSSLLREYSSSSPLDVGTEWPMPPSKSDVTGTEPGTKILRASRVSLTKNPLHHSSTNSLSTLVKYDGSPPPTNIGRFTGSSASLNAGHSSPSAASPDLHRPASESHWPNPHRDSLPPSELPYQLRGPNRLFDGIVPAQTKSARPVHFMKHSASTPSLPKLKLSQLRRTAADDSTDAAPAPIERDHRPLAGIGSFAETKKKSEIDEGPAPLPPKDPSPRVPEKDRFPPRTEEGAQSSSDDEEKARLERERNEFLAWQEEQKAKMIEKERQREKERELRIRLADEAKRERVMRKLMEEQNKWIAKTEFADTDSPPVSLDSPLLKAPPATPGSPGPRSPGPRQEGAKTPRVRTASGEKDKWRKKKGAPPPLHPPPSVPPPKSPGLASTNGTTLAVTNLRAQVSSSARSRTVSFPGQAPKSPSSPGFPSDAAPLSSMMASKPSPSDATSHAAEAAGAPGVHQRHASHTPSAGVLSSIRTSNLAVESARNSSLAASIAESGWQRVDIGPSDDDDDDDDCNGNGDAVGDGRSSSSLEKHKDNSAVLAANTNNSSSNNKSSSNNNKAVPKTPSPTSSPTISLARKQWSQMLAEGMEGESWITRHTKRQSEEGNLDRGNGRWQSPLLTVGRNKELPSFPSPTSPLLEGIPRADLRVQQQQQQQQRRLHNRESERQLEARRRAFVTDQLAQAQVDIARAEQKRLELEIAELKRREKERTELEALARAKWARQQVELKQLDAFERSKKEAEQRRRKAALQSLQDEEKRKEIELVKEAEAQKKRYEEEVANNERRKKDAQERALRLQEEADAMKKRREEREKKHQERKATRQELRSRLETLKGDDQLVLEGIVNVQFEGQLRWRRKAFELKGSTMLLRSPDGDISAIPSQPVETIEVTRNSILSLTDTFEEIQTPHSFRVTFNEEHKGQGGHEDTSVLLSTNSEEEKEKLMVGLSVLSDYHDLTL